MQRLVTSKLMTTVALTAGAAALSVLGSSPAGAVDVNPGATSSQMSTQAGSQSGAEAAASVNGKVVSRLPLTIRSRATTDSADLGSYAPGTIVHLKCKVNGQDVDGNPRWYKLSDRTGWLAARYVQNLGNVPWC